MTVANFVRNTQLAISMVRRHRLAERFLTDILKIPWHQTHEEACLLEHAMTERVVERLYDVLGEPETCPHGNPIPMGHALPVARGVPLSSVIDGSTAVVERISEEADCSSELMEHFERTGVKPGAAITVQEVADYAGTISVSIGTKSVSLGTKAAAMVWVIPDGKT